MKLPAGVQTMEGFPQYCRQTRVFSGECRGHQERTRGLDGVGCCVPGAFNHQLPSLSTLRRTTTVRISGWGLERLACSQNSEPRGRAWKPRSGHRGSSATAPGLVASRRPPRCAWSLPGGKGDVHDAQLRQKAPASLSVAMPAVNSPLTGPVAITY